MSTSNRCHRYPCSWVSWLSFGALALVLFFSGRRIFASSLGSLIRPLPALGLLAAVVIAGAVAARVAGPGTLVAAGNDTIAPHLQSQPNVILVMVDTLRADHLSLLWRPEDQDTQPMQPR